MDLDDIEIQSVEVINNPDGTRTCRIGYVPKPRSMQDPYKRAQVQFVQMGPAPNPAPTGIPDRPQPPRPAPPAPPPKPRTNPIKPLQASFPTPLKEAWKHGSVKALVIGFGAAIILQIIFVIMRAS